MKQEDIRQKCKYLKWSKDVSYREMAEYIGMKVNSFYNFISCETVKLSYEKISKLLKLIEELSGNG